MTLFFRATLIMLLTSAVQGVYAAQVDADKAAIEKIIIAIEKGWESGNGRPFYQHYLDHTGARYIESGGQNKGLKDLVENHVEPEKEVLSRLTIDILDMDISIDDDMAWAITTINVSGEVRRSSETFDKNGYQTYLFKRTNSGWKVIHSHSSTRDKRPHDHH
ncbi:nuclear transport factor 2 family protein [Aliiglaciecola lipolytica]|uniref:L-asparaginase n=1 Tax=Aliiglaciecola lipolytica E3 TaxID=1127673 RepID=K6YFB7_9ALTE|nr:nuclear transport factor 2 family protein [Aliiglaciecola lipolytica]GAC16827.1 L-asparaginase [Aliiglaciecola lipolytica E3]